MEIEKLTNKFIISLESILKRIELKSIDDILDSRDSDLFSSQWIKAWNEMSAEKINLERELEEIFKLVFRKTESDDLSAYITEDFELIANHLKLGENKWVTSLCNSYFNGKIPEGKIKASNKTLVELLNE
ncbi:hypothetical protein [Algibacter sp. L3A6]|uniref:hypothetical protein n=1 Tax=Algibacter sp. L3A6 TaxID=2686366 RepID=UPI00131B40CF|nr:hypothetical protein [Algibacter sp. L3A6]